jgi:hypothetical protein
MQMPDKMEDDRDYSHEELIGDDSTGMQITAPVPLLRRMRRGSISAKLTTIRPSSAL